MTIAAGLIAPRGALRGILAGLLLGAAAAHAQAGPLTLFGVDLSQAQRAALREAVKQAGLRPTRVDDRYYCDKYDVNGRLDEAQTLLICYTGGDDRFAYAQYEFPAFMDTELVGRVIDMVKLKYGRPDRMSGRVALGPVQAVWQQGEGMRVEVSRGWPDTTAYLSLIHGPNKDRLEAQIEAQKAQQQRQKAQRQSNAF